MTTKEEILKGVFASMKIPDEKPSSSIGKAPFAPHVEALTKIIEEMTRAVKRTTEKAVAEETQQYVTVEQVELHLRAMLKLSDDLEALTKVFAALRFHSHVLVEVMNTRAEQLEDPPISEE